MENYILNGAPVGDVASRLMQNNFDTNVLRPYIGEDGKTYITKNAGGKPKAVPVWNSTATLRKDDWKLLDDAIIQAAKPRLRAVADVRGAGLTYNIPDGMGKTILESENISDVNPASISMDGLRAGPNDRPEFDLVSLPLPIIHKDFHYSARQVAASRTGGSPLDTTHAELAARRVAEEAEKLLIGEASSYMYGGATIYGYTNFPQRSVINITDPTTSAWTPQDTLEEVLEMRQASVDDYHFGPWMLYFGINWDRYLDEDFKNESDITLRERLLRLNGIQDVRTLDYLSGYDAVLVQMTSNVVREVVGMDITTLQWETYGGMQLNFKVMAIMVPQLRADHNDKTGIVHGDAS